MDVDDGDRSSGAIEPGVGESRIIELSAGHLVPEDGAPLPPRRRMSRRRRWLVALSLVVALIGVGVVGGTYYVDSVQLNDLLTLPASTTLFYNDGTVLARLGEVDRTPVALNGMLPFVAQAAVAADDPDFWTDGTGPITRSVVRIGADLGSGSTSTRARVAILAWKLDDRYSKNEILDYYLNGVYFGRNAYGIEAAALAYYGASVRADAREPLTLAQAMVLIGLLNQPEADPDNPSAPGFDPGNGPVAAENSVRRWGEIRDAMVSAGQLSPADAAAMTYPAPPRPRLSGPRTDTGQKPSGLVINHVLSELTTGNTPWRGKTRQSITDGGLEITTTLDPRAQSVLEATADETVVGSVLDGEAPVFTAAAVAVEPGTGRVLAYYGGHDGLGNDYAGYYVDETGTATGVGRYPPGGSFMPYTLAAALRSGYSLNSQWQWTQHAQVGRPTANPIRNVGECASDRSARTGKCSLLESTSQALNVPLYDVTASVGAVKVLELARDAGIDDMWNDARERQSLREPANLGALTPSAFDVVLGIGQYSVTVLDQANAMATFAADGQRAEAHFVRQVRQGSDVLYAEQLTAGGAPRIYSSAVAADLTWALSQGRQLGGMDVARQFGSWEYNNASNLNAHAWTVGYTSSLALAVWIGSRADERPLLDRNNATIWGSGLPNTLFERFMTQAHPALGLRPGPFAPPAFAGRVDPPLSVPG